MGLLEETLEHAHMSELEAKELFLLLDTDNSGTIGKEEFVESLQSFAVPPTAKHLLRLTQDINRTGSKVDGVSRRLRDIDDQIRIAGETLRRSSSSDARFVSVSTPAEPLDANADLANLHREIVDA